MTGKKFLFLAGIIIIILIGLYLIITAKDNPIDVKQAEQAAGLKMPEPKYVHIILTPKPGFGDKMKFIGTITKTEYDYIIQTTPQRKDSLLIKQTSIFAREDIFNCIITEIEKLK